MIEDPNTIPVIAGLLAKRAEIEGDIAELEREIRRRRSEVMQIRRHDPSVRPEPTPRQAIRDPVPAVGALHGGRTHQAVPDGVPGG
jgi:hypothetical protein